MSGVRQVVAWKVADLSASRAATKRNARAWNGHPGFRESENALDKDFSLVPSGVLAAEDWPIKDIAGRYM